MSIVYKMCSKEDAQEKLNREYGNTLNLEIITPSKTNLEHSSLKVINLSRRIKSIAIAKCLAKSIINAIDVLSIGREITEKEFEAKIDLKVKQKIQFIPQFKMTNEEKKKFLYTYLRKPIQMNDGSYYYGTWDIYGKRHGLGKSILPNGGVYIGLWVRDVINIRGILLNRNGDFFEGQFEKGKANGKGLFIKENGTRYYGDWKSDLQDGEGEENFSNGSKYFGQFSNGTKTGLGTFLWPDGSSYNGMFNNNAIHGKGTYKWADNKIYNGEWINNQIHGFGVFIYGEGKKYQGFFKNDKKDGYGIYNWNDTKYYDGNWQDGKRHGYGTLYVGNKVKKGIWTEGKLTKDVSGNEEQKEKEIEEKKIKLEENVRRNENFFNQYNTMMKKKSQK